ncbi:hypothetical protein [Sulfoacidibacillus thermotolerans]|uniref:Uncharacterized protein n=1 Tax=Sulfoacidibacillus thermotolerans TaxID=1765684 RepID=A0A2U3D5M9_SULT2|nr:hypothetical protein [Sulfoacidibacillus thermotolerans]PWI56596.1 hypothetical protein BM613_12910 [Sulfoacidibacillus thermotolerans]
MFVKEWQWVLSPWIVFVVLLDPHLAKNPLVLLAALYVVATEIRYRFAVFESRRAGFQRMVRIPVSRTVLQLLLRGRVSVPQGVPCYTLHVETTSTDYRTFLRELREDIVRGAKTKAFYVGNTFTQLGEFAQKEIGKEKVQIISGTFFPAWLQTAGIDVRRIQQKMFRRTFPLQTEWKIVAIQTQKEDCQ